MLLLIIDLYKIVGGGLSISTGNRKVGGLKWPRASGGLCTHMGLGLTHMLNTIIHH